jgi:hypothetical protein
MMHVITTLITLIIALIRAIASHVVAPVTIIEVKMTLFFLLTITVPLGVRHMEWSPTVSKASGIMLLSVAQYFRLAVHPLVVPPNGTTFVNHLWTFVRPVTVVITAAFFLRSYGFMPGYPPVGEQTLVSSFMAVVALFGSYLILFKALLRNGYTSQYANGALFTVIQWIPMNPLHPNPVVILVSAVTYGAYWLYPVQVAGVAVGVLVSKLEDAVRVTLVERMKKD